jgi:RHS repeat-associated protein
MDGSVFDSMDYLPFGQQIAGNAGSTHKFTGKERDAESGLDNLNFRYYSSIQGRFSRADEPFAAWDQHDPQSLNLYSYVENNPLASTDPSGMVMCRPTNADDEIQDSPMVCDVSDSKYVTDPKKYTQLGYTHYDCSCDSDADRVAWHAYTTDHVGTNDVSTDFLAVALGARTFYGVAVAVGKAIEGVFEDSAEEESFVIGKMGDLETGPGAIRTGESRLPLASRPDLTPKENWASNSSKLRQIMDLGRPIRDASFGNSESNTGFLRAERNLLENYGWRLLSDGYWHPPL